VIVSETVQQKTPVVTGHRFWVAALSGALFGIILWVAVRGFDYYILPVSERALHPGHTEFRPSGTTGIKLGIFAAGLFFAIYLYPFRKKFKFLRFMGSTKTVLDYHIVMGLAAAPIVALHSAFKFGGLAGMAFWVMMAVVISGIVGRYLYAQIPRSKKDSEFSLVELEQMRIELAAQLEHREFEGLEQLDRLNNPFHGKPVAQMSILSALFAMMTLDLRRPFQVAALRRKNLSIGDCFLTFGGLFRSRHYDLEQTIALARRQSWLSAKIFFLDRAGQIFQLWHVIHRPFSYAFLVLAVLHIGLALYMGFI